MSIQRIAADDAVNDPVGTIATYLKELEGAQPPPRGAYARR
ncbi:hypothetical protein QTH90_23865 [Variovorax sp. J2P1-59]|nr:hypothetical protein [Variovorax sp. J2P1-59]MDM0077464.1 hypothetical protein [Variovorax sp. J2P1-59]